jgi:hypothetical protein
MIVTFCAVQVSSQLSQQLKASYQLMLLHPIGELWCFQAKRLCSQHGGMQHTTTPLFDSYV